ncbi:SIR2 family protein [Parvibaculum sp.]|uniref:SIR2 family protein n=1 Tax=Parvibaculum sp. TaxID=2024848 RepID=UPI003918963E
MPKQKPSRKIIYFIGAGASYGAGATAAVQGGGKVPIPIQKEFWPTFLRFCTDREKSKRIEAFLFRYFLNYAKVPGRHSSKQRRELLADIDVEEVFTFLSERIQAPGTSSQLRTYTTQIWDDLVSEIGNVFGRYKANKSTRHSYGLLLQNHVRSRDAVVSFNYDTIFELSMPTQKQWHYVGVSKTANGLKLIKPHGSINWTLAKHEIRIQENPEQSLIVAPTHLKFVGSENDDNKHLGTLNHSEEIKFIWEQMEREMQSAKAFVFIGYSFPVADLYFSSVLRSVLAIRKNDPAVVLVNPDAVDIQRRLQQRFSIKKVFNYFDMDTFFDIKRDRLLNRIQR